MHFRSDEQFLKLTKILEIKNKGNYRGSVPIFRRPNWHFSKIFLFSVFWNTLVQVGVKYEFEKYVFFRKIIVNQEIKYIKVK